jgi:outer membrane protein OmpA-like peptidoglycan-associated protein
MFEPRHGLKPARTGLLGGVVALGLVFGTVDAGAQSLSAAPTATMARGALLAQSQGREAGAPDAPASGPSAEQEVPFSELNEALSAARARLAELTKAAEIAKVASALREDLAIAKAENKHLKAALVETRAAHADLEVAEQAAGKRADEAGRAAAEAVAAAKRLDEELVAVRWQNSQLSTSLTLAETSARERDEALKKARSELSSRVQALSSTAEKSATEITRLQSRLEKAEERSLLAERRGDALEEELALRSVETDDVKAETDKLATDLDRTITELRGAQAELASTRDALDDVSIALAGANQEAAVLREQVAANRQDADRLRGELETTQGRLSQVNAMNKELQDQVGVLRTAAGEATDAARLNLIAVEKQINEINAALATVKADELTMENYERAEAEAAQRLTEAVDAPGGGDGRTAFADAAGDLWVPKVTPARAAAQSRQRQLIAAASPSAAGPVGAGKPSAASSPFASRVVSTATAATRDAEPPTAIAALIAGLSETERRQAESLLTGLDVRSERRGLSMTVPGTILFAVNSEKIEPDAYGTLAKVAEVVDLYQDRSVLIVGHTDAVGDDEYNQQLSERRADLVRNYFVDEFAIGRERLSIEGQGEQRPITSNATSEGRDANRRIEVIILD